MTDDKKDVQPLPVSAETSKEEEDETFSNNYAMAIALGLPFGAVFGMLIFDNIALGAGLGLVLAPVIALFMGRSKAAKRSDEVVPANEDDVRVENESSND